MKCVHVLRKPCSEPIVAANVLRYGTGAVNVDATRVPTTPSERSEMLTMPQGFAGRKWGRPEVANYGYEAIMPVKTVSIPSDGGRWPANLVLQHLDGCVQDEVKKVKAMGATGSRYAGTEGPANIDPGDAPLARRAWVSDDGTETVAAWACVEGCPVAALDAQSGATKSVTRKPTGKPIYATEGSAMVWNSNSVTDTTERGFADEGGASRFFKQVGGKVSGEE